MKAQQGVPADAGGSSFSHRGQTPYPLTATGLARNLPYRLFKH